MANSREPLAVDTTRTAGAPDAASTPVDDEADARASTTLSERDIAILAFERQWWRHAGAKEQGIRAEFGLSAARYYQVLGILLDSPQALAHDPMLVNRLHRMREARAAARAHRALPVS